MEFHQKFLQLHAQFFMRMHSFPSSAIAFLCHMSTDPKREWKPAALAEKFGYNYVTCTNTLKRLRLEGFVDGRGCITAAGLSAAGHARQGEDEEPLP